MGMWGSKLVYRKLGYVADFCQICISARPFVLERIGMAKQLLNFSVGEGELVDYQRVCLHCSTALRANPQQYTSIAKQLDTIEPLMRQSFPHMAQAHAPRLQLEAQIAADPLAIDADTRGKLLLEPFVLLSPRVVKRFDNAHYEVAHAFLRSEVIPLLGQTLARLRPTEQELQATLNQLIEMKELIGAKITLADLMADLNARLAGTLAPVAGNPVKHLSSGSKAPYRHAATIFKVLGGLATALSLFILFGMVLQGRDGKDFEIAIGQTIAMLLFLAAVPGLQFAVAAGLERQKKWARITAIVLSIAFLFAFPIGTVIGIYVIWALTAAWED